MIAFWLAPRSRQNDSAAASLGVVHSYTRLPVSAWMPSANSVASLSVYATRACETGGTKVSLKSLTVMMGLQGRLPTEAEHSSPTLHRHVLSFPCLCMSAGDRFTVTRLEPQTCRHSALFCAERRTRGYWMEAHAPRSRQPAAASRR